MDKRESEAREVLAKHGLEVTDAGGFMYRANVAIAPAIVAAMLEFANRPAADLEAVREACAKVAEDMILYSGQDIATAIRSLDLSALSCAGEWK